VGNIIFKKHKLSKWFVELSFGKVYFKEITHKLRNDIEIASKGNLNAIYTLYEYVLPTISKRKINALSITDSDKLRAKIKEVLLEYKILIIEEPIKIKNKEADLFSKQDIEWFNKKGDDFVKKMSSGKHGR